VKEKSTFHGARCLGVQHPLHRQSRRSLPAQRLACNYWGSAPPPPAKPPEPPRSETRFARPGAGAFALPQSPLKRPVLAGCPRRATFRACLPQGHVGRTVRQHSTGIATTCFMDALASPLTCARNRAGPWLLFLPPLSNMWERWRACCVPSSIFREVSMPS